MALASRYVSLLHAYSFSLKNRKGHENKTDTKDDIMVKKTIAAFFTVLVLSSALTACNTTRGVGEDISDGGNAISGAATKAQQ